MNSPRTSQESAPELLELEASGQHTSGRDGPLHDSRVEEALLSAALDYPDSLPSLSSIVSAADFHIVRHRWLWEAFLRLQARHSPIDVVTVESELRRAGHAEQNDAAIFLARITGAAPSCVHGEGYARAVRDLSLRRKLLAEASSLAVVAHDQGQDLKTSIASWHEELDSVLDGAIADQREQWTPADLCSQELSATPWLLEGHLVDGGVGLLVGPAGAGKTYLALDLALAVYSGGSAWGCKAQKGNVLYIGPDSPRRTFQHRLVELCRGRGIEPPGDGFLLDLSPLDLGTPAGARELRRLAERAEAKLVVIDALYCVMPGLDENAAGDVGLVMGRIRESAGESGASHLVNHHANKKDVTLSNRVRGSSALVGAVDTGDMVLIDGSGDHMVRTLAPFKNREAPELSPSRFTIENTEAGTVLAFGPSALTTTSGTLAELAVGQLAAALQAASQPLSRKELEGVARGQGLAGAQRTVDEAFALLQRLPQVRTTKAGRANLYSWEAS